MPGPLFAALLLRFKDLNKQPHFFKPKSYNKAALNLFNRITTTLPCLYCYTTFSKAFFMPENAKEM